jgi:hypothetical protein
MNFARVMDAAFERGELTTVKDAAAAPQGA